MPAPWVDIDRVPAIAQPAEVVALIDEARGLRDKLRHAAEQTAAAQTQLDQAQQADSEAAAERVRKGSPLGPEQPAVAKARSALEAAKRSERALELAVGAALVDLGSAIRAADGWLVELDAELEQARRRGLDALAQLEQAANEVSTAAGAKNWLLSGLADGRLDRPMKPALLGHLAPSSAKLTVNSAPLSFEQLITFCLELFAAEPAPVPQVVLGAAGTADAA